MKKLDEIVQEINSRENDLYLLALFHILGFHLNVSLDDIASKFQSEDLEHPGVEINYLITPITTSLTDESTLEFIINDQIAIYLKVQSTTDSENINVFRTLPAFTHADSNTYRIKSDLYKPKMTVNVDDTELELGIKFIDAVVVDTYSLPDTTRVNATYTFINLGTYIFIQKHDDEVFKVEVSIGNLAYVILRDIERDRLSTSDRQDVINAKVNALMDPPIARDVRFTSPTVGLDAFVRGAHSVYLTKNELCEAWCKHIANVVPITANEEFSNYLEHV